MSGSPANNGAAQPAYTTPAEALLFYARRYSQAPASASAFSNFIVRLRVATDLDAVLAVARQFAHVPEIALPAWHQAVELKLDNLGVLIEAASAFYANGIDVEAEHLVEMALELDARSIDAWQLKAALTADPQARRQVFEHILQIEPGNRVAVDNLILLGRPL